MTESLNPALSLGVSPVLGAVFFGGLGWAVRQAVSFGQALL